MAKRKARDGEVEAASAAAAQSKSVAMKRKRRRRRKESSGSGMCDDVIRSIFARVPARTAVASMAVSKHHRRQMRCPEFRALHCRLAPPLPHPHVAYIATAKVRRRTRRSGGAWESDPVSGYHGFHVAGGAGLGGSNNANAPMRALEGPMYIGKSYVNTCNGVVLLAGGPRPSTCVLWNPAVADEEKEVTVPVSARDDCAILGLGYGMRSETYKLLLARRRKRDDSKPIILRRSRSPNLKELVVYELSGAGEQPPRSRTLLSGPLDGGISGGQSLYLDGTIFLLHHISSVLLAFDVDDETVTTIRFPGEVALAGEEEEEEPHFPRAHLLSSLLVLSGRPCVDMMDRHGGRALWLLTAELHWERRCVFLEGPVPVHDYQYGFCYSIAGVWDCGGMLVLYQRMSGKDKLLMCCTATKKKMAEVNLPSSLTPERSDYALCWGYKPTLVSPGSIVGELSQDEEIRRLDCTRGIMAALKPVNERDRRKGQKATLDTVCFMEFLLRIMQKLPENMQDVIEMPLLKSEDSGPGSSDKDGFYHSASDSNDKDELNDSDSDTDFVARRLIKFPIRY